MRKLLLDSAETLLLLQKGNAEKIPSLVSSDSTAYVLKRIHAVADVITKTSSNITTPYSNVRKKTFDVAGFLCLSLIIENSTRHPKLVMIW